MILFSSIISSPPPLFLTLSGDPTWNLAVSGSTFLMAISAVAFEILQFPPINAFCWTSVGFATGFLAKKTICHYCIPQSLTRLALTFNDRLHSARSIAFFIALIASFVFTILAAVFAVSVGIFAGFLFKPQREDQIDSVVLL